MDARIVELHLIAISKMIKRSLPKTDNSRPDLIVLLEGIERVNCYLDSPITTIGLCLSLLR